MRKKGILLASTLVVALLFSYSVSFAEQVADIGDSEQATVSVSPTAEQNMVEPDLEKTPLPVQVSPSASAIPLAQVETPKPSEAPPLLAPAPTAVPTQTPEPAATVAFTPDTALTRQKLCQIIIEQLEQRGTITRFAISERPFNDTQDLYVQNCYALGLVRGDGKGSFYPNQTITKEDASVIFKRLQDYVVPRLIYDTAKSRSLMESFDLHNYSSSSISLLSSVGAINTSTFRPQAVVTQTDTLAVIDKIYQNKSLPVSIPGRLPQKKVPILMYHQIEDPKPGNPLSYVFVNPANFEAQIKYLSENGYTFLFPDEMYYADQCQKAVVITFDDGYKSNYTKAFPILKKYNAKATIFVTSDKIGSQWYLNQSEIQEMADSGLVTIGSHSTSHPRLTDLNSENLDYELSHSKATLEAITKKPVTNLAYPFGAYSDSVVSSAKKYYSCAFSVQYGRDGDPFQMKRHTIDYWSTISDLQNILSWY